jgi:cell division protein FtsZ
MSNGNNISIDLAEPEYLRAIIKVIGVGGGGCNAIKNMIDGNIKGVELIAANTDAQALADNKAKIKIQLGKRLTKGLGAGGDPEVGRKAAEESEQEIREIVSGSEMVFVTCGMGGGTGTGATPVVARVAKESGALVVAIVTRPFEFEGKHRIENAKKGIDELRKNVDAIIVIPNQKIYDIIEEDLDADEALKKIDEILLNSTRGISDIINNPGHINVDFADVKSIMKDKGDALMGIGYANGENRAKEAAIKAVTSPLLDGISIAGAKGLLVNITSGKSVGIKEMQTVIKTIQEFTGEDVNLIYGMVKTNEETDILSVTVVAAGFESKNDVKFSNNSSDKNTIFDPNPFLSANNGLKRNTPIDVKRRLEEINKKNTPKPQTVETISTIEEQNTTIEIPRGDKIKYYDQPTISRDETFKERIANSQQVSTLFPSKEEKIQTTTTLNTEKNSVENYPRGIDFMSMGSTGDNYIQRFML